MKHSVYLLVLLLVSLSSYAQYNTNEVALQLQSSLSSDSRAELTKQLRVIAGESVTVLYPGKSSNSFFQKVIVLRSTEPIETDVFESLKALPFVQVAEYTPQWDYTFVPNDVASSQWSLQTIQAEDAWDIEQGDPNVKIAIIDDAFSLSHEDFLGQFWNNTNEIANNGIDDDGNGYIDDVLGWDGADNDNDVSSSIQALGAGRHDHGSHVAGIASGATNNGRGMASIGFNTRVMPLKTARSTGSYGLSFSGILTAMDYAVENSANIISMSLGGSGYSVIFQNAVTLAHDSGIVVIASAGNNRNTQLMYPASYKHVISVASSAQSDVKSSFTTYNDSVDITAPGSAIYSIQARTTSNTTYSNKSGTSMACPMVAGVVALMISKNPALSPDQIEACLKSGADDITSQNPTSAWGLGAGRLNAYQSLQCVKSVLAKITVDKTTTCAGDTLFFSDNSIGSITQRVWTFTGGTPSSSTSPNPTVVYTADGMYTVRLIVSDGVESDTSELLQYISIQQPSATLSSSTVSVRLGQAANLPISFVGNPPYRFKINNGSSSYWVNNIYANPYYLQVSPVDTTVYSLDSMYDASCSGSTSGSFTVNLYRASNLISECVTFQPGPSDGTDALLSSIQPSTNAGNHPDILATAWTSGGTPLTGRSVLDFDWDQIPSNAVIDSAYLSLYYNNTSGNAGHSGANSAKLYRITSSWTESTVTWNNQPTYSLANSVAVGPTVSNSQDTEGIEITGLVKDIWSDRAGSYGFMFKLDNESIYRSQKYASSDHLDPLKRPKLKVCYSAPEQVSPITCLKVSVKQKISDTEGNFTAIFNNTDRFGDAIENAGDLDADGVEDLIVGASFLDDGGTDRGGVYQLYMNSDGTVKSYQAISSTQGGFGSGLGNADRFGATIAVLGDLDNDGIEDYAISAHSDDDGGINRGSIYILFMNANGTVKSKQKISDTQGSFSYSLNNYDFFGLGLAAIGDLDNDGNEDLAIGIHQDDDAGTNAGAICIVFLNSNGTVKSYQHITNGQGGFGNHLDAQDYFGESIKAIGDIDADGNMDIAVGAGRDDDGGQDRGAIYILRLNANGTVKNTTKISSTSAEFINVLSNSDYFGRSISRYPDMDNNNIDELVIGAFGDDNGGTDKGAVYLVGIGSSGNANSVKKIAESFVGSLTLDNDDLFGISVAVLPDYDNDGFSDIAVGAATDDDGGSDRGAVYILDLVDSCSVQKSPLTCLKTTVKQKISDTEGNFTATFGNGDYFGTGIQRAGDLDGDGVEDLLAGASFSDDGGTDRGKFYQLYMNSNGTVKSYQAISSTQGGFGSGLDASDAMGWSTAFLGDLDNDGVADYAVSAHGDDDGGTNRGAIYILLMNANGTVKSKQKISDTQGGFNYNLSNNDFFGVGLEAVGDLDSDGNMDIAVGIQQDDNAGTNCGAICIIFLNSNGTVKDYKQITNGVNGFGNFLSPQDYFGMSIEAIGDLDSDGNVDIAVGSLRDDDGGNDKGAIYIINLNSNGTVKNTNKISGTSGGLGNILNASGQFGISISKYKDIDSDGNVEILVGAYLDDDGGTDNGAVYLLRVNRSGNVTSSKKITKTSVGNLPLDVGDIFGSGVGTLPDYDGDGYADIVVGAGQDDDGGLNRGALYVLSLFDTCAIPPPIDTPACRLNADFSYIGTCLTDSFEFVSNSTDSGESKIIGYNWSIDGELIKGDSALGWRFATGGNKTISLVIRNDDGYNCRDTFSLTIDVKDTLSYSIEGENIICFGDTTELFVNIDSCTTGPFSYFWTPQIDISDPNVADPKIFTRVDRTYSVTVFSSTGKFLQKSFTIDVDSTCCESNAMFGIQGEPFCPSDSVGFINSSISLGSGTTYRWAFGSDAHLTSYLGANPPNISYSTAGVKTVSLILSDDCDTDTFTMNFTINELPFVPTFLDTVICQGDSVLLTNEVETSVNYEWGPSSEITYIDAEAYFVAARARNQALYYVNTDIFTGCTDTSFFEAQVDSLIALSLGVDTNICSDSFILLPANTTNVAWGDGSLAPSLVVSANDTYSGTIINGECSSSDSVTITFFKENGEYLPEDTTYCDIGGLLSAKSLPIGVIANWSTGQSGTTITTTTEGDYWVTITSPEGCVSRDSTTVSIVKSPTIAFTGDSVVCDSVPIDISLSITDATRFVWNDDGDSTSLSKTFSTGQSVLISAFNGKCSTSKVVNIRELYTPEFTLGKDTFICDDEEFGVLLRSTSSIPLEWSNGTIAREITVFEEGDYWASSANECGSASDSIAVVEQDCNCEFLIPDAFSPNGDGVNDDFGILSNGCEVSELNYFIANRLGVIVFIGKNIEDRWDGYYSGEPALPGVYNLVLDYRLINGKYKTKVFNVKRVTVVR